MSRSEYFLDGMRRTVRRGHLRSVFWQSLFALGLVTFGSYYFSICDECAQNLWEGYLVMAAAVAGGVTWLFFIGRGVIRRRRPESDPVNVQLSHYGAQQIVAGEIEQEFSDQRFRARRIYVGRRWLCYAWKTQLTICRIDTLIWAHMERIRHSVNLIPTGTTNQMVAWRRDGRGVVMSMRRKKDVALALEALERAAPWMYVGSSDALKESWNNDREDLIALVDRRRREGISGWG
jgi:hypothetical protein